MQFKTWLLTIFISHSFENLNCFTAFCLSCGLCPVSKVNRRHSTVVLYWQKCNCWTESRNELAIPGVYFSYFYKLLWHKSKSAFTTFKYFRNFKYSFMQLSLGTNIVSPENAVHRICTISAQITLPLSKKLAMEA